MHSPSAALNQSISISVWMCIAFFFPFSIAEYSWIDYPHSPIREFQPGEFCWYCFCLSNSLSDARCSFSMDYHRLWLSQSVDFLRTGSSRAVISQAAGACETRWAAPGWGSGFLNAAFLPDCHPLLQVGICEWSSTGPSGAAALLSDGQCTSASQCQMGHEKKGLLSASAASALA